MQRTICGETRKKKIYGRSAVDHFLERNTALFESFSSDKICMYSEKFQSSDQSVNYLNHNCGDNVNNQFKSLIAKEFVDCEKIYPHLGDVFLSKYFEPHTTKYSSDEKYLFTRETCCNFSETFKFKITSQIFEKLIESTTLEYTVSLEKSALCEIHVEKNDDLNFNLDYDSSFLGKKAFHTMKGYRFIIIDGHIATVGELHHLFEKASSSKIPYVVFCFGMSPEVDHVIKVNNTAGNFEIFPVVIKFDENTINVLSDIAVLHNSSVISSKLGQTISQSVSKDLESGKEITFSREGFKIKPVAKKRALDSHVGFLNRRIRETSNEENKKLLTKRLKNFKSKHVKIYLPENAYENNDLIRDIDYMLRFLKFCKRVFSPVNCNGKTVYIPVEFIEIAFRKVESLKKTIANIDGAVLYARC